MQGNIKVMLAGLELAAESARRNDDDYLARMVTKRGGELQAWASLCLKKNLGLEPGALATATANPTP